MDRVGFVSREGGVRFYLCNTAGLNKAVFTFTDPGLDDRCDFGLIPKTLAGLRSARAPTASVFVEYSFKKFAENKFFS